MVLLTIIDIIVKRTTVYLLYIKIWQTVVLLTIISIIVEVASLAVGVIQLVLLLIQRHESKKNRR